MHISFLATFHQKTILQGIIKKAILKLEKIKFRDNIFF